MHGSNIYCRFVFLSCNGHMHVQIYITNLFFFHVMDIFIEHFISLPLLFVFILYAQSLIHVIYTDMGVERGIHLEGLTEEQISKAVEDLAKLGAALKG